MRTLIPVTDQSTSSIFIIIDTKGAGRVVGVFDDRDRAEAIRGVDRAYFRMTSLPLNAVNPVAVDWLLSASQREQLRNV